MIISLGVVKPPEACVVLLDVLHQLNFFTDSSHVRSTCRWPQIIAAAVFQQATFTQASTASHSSGRKLLACGTSCNEKGSENCLLASGGDLAQHSGRPQDSDSKSGLVPSRRGCGLNVNGLLTTTLRHMSSLVCAHPLGFRVYLGFKV